MSRKNQIAEQVFRDAATNHYCTTYVKKFQTQPLAHESNEADYMVSTFNNLHFVEVKECQGKSFPFDRLTQRAKLRAFSEALSNHRGWVFLYFRRKFKVESTAFCIPIGVFCDFITNSARKSINENECITFFCKYRCSWDDDNKQFSLPL